MQDLKRSKEGAKYFEECDAYNFLRLAMKEHQYLSPAVSSAAVARAKDEFERYRQRAEDSIIEHINEYRRRLEVYIKARGPDQVAPYADFDLRDMLLRSLYQPTWGPWIESRYLNDNMPKGYEDLITALKMAESTKILRASSPIDPFQPTAHATSSPRPTFTPPSSPGPVKCAVCGNLFCPKRPQHTRCDQCQEEYSKRAKKERKKESDKKKGKGKGTKEKRAHATGTKGRQDEYSGDEDEDEDHEEFEHEGTSFNCICSTRATSP